jgi:hypothetical protein
MRSHADSCVRYPETERNGMPARLNTLATSGTGHCPQYASHLPVSKFAWSMASVGCRSITRTGVCDRWAIGRTIEEVR